MRKFLLIAVFVLSLVSIASCTNKDKDSSPSSSPSDGVEVEAGGSYRPEWDNDFELPEDYFN